MMGILPDRPGILVKTRRTPANHEVEDLVSSGVEGGFLGSGDHFLSCRGLAVVGQCSQRDHHRHHDSQKEQYVSVRQSHRFRNKLTKPGAIGEIGQNGVNSLVNNFLHVHFCTQSRPIRTHPKTQAAVTSAAR